MKPLVLRVVLVVGAGVAASAIAVTGVFVGFWVFLHVIVGLPLKHQPALVRFPPLLPVSARATNTVQIKLNGYIDAAVPFRQTLSLPLHGAYDTDIHFDTWVPITFTVRYRGAIPVNTFATVHAVTDFNYEKVKRLRNVAFSARIPLRFEQPVSLTVPVSARVHLVYHGPLGVVFNQTVSAPVDTVLHTRLKAVRDITTPILARFGLDVGWPRDGVPVVIEYTDISLPLKKLRLDVTPGENAAATPGPATASPVQE